MLIQRKSGTKTWLCEFHRTRTLSYKTLMTIRSSTSTSSSENHRLNIKTYADLREHWYAESERIQRQNGATFVDTYTMM